MTDIFVYGTLRHEPLLRTVLGHAVETLLVEPAYLPDMGCYFAEGQGFPMVQEQARGRAEGLLLRGVNDADLARLDFYERVFNYRQQTRSIMTKAGAVTATLWWPPKHGHVPGAPFNLETWARDWAAINIRAATEIMAHYGQRPPEALRNAFGLIQGRAASWVYAQSEAVSSGLSGLGPEAVEIQEVRQAYVEFFSVDEYVLKFRKFNGEFSDTVQRAVFLSSDASLVLPYDPVRDRVLLIEQFRVAPLARGDQNPWQLEPIAGRVDAGESPEACARREAVEEAGLQVGALELIHRGYPSPGCLSEYYHLYLGLADLPDEAAGVAGLDGEQEDIRSHILSFDQVMEMLDQGYIRVTPLATALLWLARNRDRLRSSA